MVNCEGEVKIVFREGSEIRSIHGHIIDQDNSFFWLQRKDGKIAIAKSSIIKIDNRQSEGGFYGFKNLKR